VVAAANRRFAAMAHGGAAAWVEWPNRHAVVLPASPRDTNQFGMDVERHDDSPLLGRADPEPPVGRRGAIIRRDDDVRH
jgi:hypothetical protein